MSDFERQTQLSKLINNGHQCFQLYAIDQSIDFEEFKRRLDTDNVDYRQVLIDYQDLLQQLEPEISTLYIQRIIDLVYT